MTMRRINTELPERQLLSVEVGSCNDAATVPSKVRHKISSILSGRVTIYLLLMIAMCASYFLHHQKHYEMGNDVFDALFMEKWRTLNDEQKSKLYHQLLSPSIPPNNGKDEKSNNALEEKLTKMVTEANSAVISKVEGLESKVTLGLGGIGLKLQEQKLEQEAASDHEEGETRNNILLNLLKKSSEFSKQKIANLIISEYIEPSSDSELGDAMEALQLLEDDPEPVPITDHDSLFVGSVGKFYSA